MGAVVLGLSAYAGYRTYDAYAKVSESDLLLANAEALAIENEGGDMSHCSGPSIYAEVGIIEGEKEVCTHYKDDEDWITIYSIKKCWASGSGHLSGANYIYESDIKDRTTDKCRGKDGHNTLYD